jgi:hypothetical protein
MAKTNNAEGGTDTVTVTIGNSGGISGDAFTTVSIGTGGAITYSATRAMHGSLSYAFVIGSGATLVDLDESLADDQFTARVAVNLTAYPSASTPFPFNVRNTAGTTNLGGTNLSTTGQLQVAIGGTLSSFTTPVLALNTWYRLEYYGSGFGTAASASTCDAYVGDNTGTPFATCSVSGVTTANGALRMRFGKPSGTSTLATSYLDDLAYTAGSSTPLGPNITLSPGWVNGFDVRIG